MSLPGITHAYDPHLIVTVVGRRGRRCGRGRGGGGGGGGGGAEVEERREDAKVVQYSLAA
eukprot:815555-Rhodomonas_salina.3